MCAAVRKFSKKFNELDGTAKKRYLEKLHSMGSQGLDYSSLKGCLDGARIYLPSQHSSSWWSIRFSFNNNMGVYAHKDHKVLLITSSPHAPHLLTRKYTSQQQLHKLLI